MTSVHLEVFFVGSIIQIIVIADSIVKRIPFLLSDTNSGPSDDWAKGAAGIAYSSTIELRDQGPVYGFLLPAEYKLIFSHISMLKMN